MLIRDFFRDEAPVISFELFPPKTEQAEEDLFSRVVSGLEMLNPRYLSVTYGAGGGTRETTLRIADRVRRNHGLEVVHHLTCVNTTRDTMDGVLDEIQAHGITNILGLRGDPPRGETTFVPTAHGFTRAAELISHVRQRGNFCIGAACYPEGHVECSDKKRDWDFTAAKVDAGAEFLVSQLFYDWNDFLEMEDYLRTKHGVKVPIIPGILPFLRAEQIKRFTRLSGCKLPGPILNRIEELANEDESVRQYGVEVATDLCRQAIDHGVKGIHFYCLNQLTSCQEIIQNLNLPIRTSGAGR